MDIDVQDTAPSPAAPAADHRSRRRLIGAGMIGVAGSLLPQFASRVAASTPPGTGGVQNGAGSGGSGQGGAGATPATDESDATNPQVSSEPTLVATAETTPSEATTTTAPPARPTASDAPYLGFAQMMELAIVTLYDIALTGGQLGDDQGLMVTLRETHLSYAQSVSALMGKTAPDAPLGSLVDDFSAAFGGSKAKALEAAYQVEGTAMATHEDIIGELLGTDGTALIASILIAEARHCTVLADLAGSSDLDTLLLSDAVALDPTEG